MTQATIRCWKSPVNGNADYIVSGDDDLLALDPFRGIRVIRPAEFLRVAGL